MKEQDKQVQQVQNLTEESNAPLFDEELKDVSGGKSLPSDSNEGTYKYNLEERVHVGSILGYGVVKGRKTDAAGTNFYKIYYYGPNNTNKSLGWIEERKLRG